MSIFPLPVFEADADPDRRDGLTLEEQHERLKPPKTIVVRFGRMGMVGEYPSDGSIRPGCGSKLIARTHRGVEMAEMLTTTCTNAGCGKSVSRKDMRDYIETSGGAEFPFHDTGRILRIATVDDLSRDTRTLEGAHERRRMTTAIVEELQLDMKVVDVELILGGDHVTIHYMCDEKFDTRALQKRVADLFTCRVDMQQVGARDEARLVADYERCGRHCLLQELPEGAQARVHAIGQAAEGHTGSVEDLRAMRPTHVLSSVRRPDVQGTQGEPPAPQDSRRYERRPRHRGSTARSSRNSCSWNWTTTHSRIAVPLEELLDPGHVPNPGGSR